VQIWAQGWGWIQGEEARMGEAEGMRCTEQYSLCTHVREECDGFKLHKFGINLGFFWEDVETCTCKVAGRQGGD
jgi:hypothetical protein